MIHWGKLLFVATLIIALIALMYENDQGFFVQEGFRGGRRGGRSGGRSGGRPGISRRSAGRNGTYRRYRHHRNRSYPGRRFWQRWWRPSRWNWDYWLPWAVPAGYYYWNNSNLYPTYNTTPAMGLSNCDYNEGKCVFGNLCNNYMGPYATCCRYDSQCQL